MKISISKWAPEHLKQLMDQTKKSGGISKEIQEIHGRTELQQLLQESHEGYMLIGLNLKDQYNRERIARVVNHLSSIHDKDGIYRSWKFNREEIILRMEEIYFFESYDRKMTVHSRSSQYRIQTTISREMEDLEQYGFIRVHHSYLVQKNQISKVEQRKLTLNNGEEIPISRRYKKNLSLQLQEHVDTPTK